MSDESPAGSPATATTEVPSPCTKVCAMDGAGRYCLGCLRTLGEIAAWGELDDNGKRAVLRAVASRRARAETP
jgi:predicted Fe-S protein YdhL (DUF1289 family)